MSGDREKAQALCRHCEQEVTPVERRGGVLLLTVLMMLAIASVIACIISAVHPFTGSTVHGPAIAVLWPVAAAEHGWSHPKLFAVLTAAAAFLALAWLTGKLSQRAEQNARCPQCSSLMQATPAPSA